jgi:hypothetical protein
VIFFGIEKLHEIADEIEPFFKQHYTETRSIDDDIEFKPDRDAYLRASLCGHCLVVTARLESKIIGYALFYISTYPRNFTIIMASNHGFYIDKSHRGKLGSALVEQSECLLGNLGITRIEYINDNESFGRFMRLRGYECSAKIWRKKNG